MATCVHERNQRRDALTGLDDQRRRSKGTLGPELDLAVHPDEERIAQHPGTLWAAKPNEITFRNYV